MDPVVSYGKRKRGPLGQVVKWLFIGFNILMLVWLVSASFATSDLSSTTEGSAGRAGVAIGAMLGFGMLLFVWFVGAMILGVAAFLSRGDRIVIVSDGTGHSRALADQPEGQSETASKALTVAAWAATIVAFLGTIVGLSDGNLVGALLSFLVGLCAVPLIWHHPAVERRRVPVGARWATAVVFLALGPILGAGPSSNSPTKEGAGETSRWEVTEEKSAMDDSRTVVASLGAEKEVTGWLGSQKPYLHLRCLEGQLELYVDAGTQMATDFSIERGRVAEARYRIDDDQPVKVNVESSTDGNAFFLPAPTTIVRKLVGGKRLAVEYTPFNAGLGTAVFHSVGIETVLKRMPPACQVEATERNRGKPSDSASASLDVAPHLVKDTPPELDIPVLYPNTSRMNKAQCSEYSGGLIDGGKALVDGAVVRVGRNMDEVAFQMYPDGGCRELTDEGSEQDG